MIIDHASVYCGSRKAIKCVYLLVKYGYVKSFVHQHICSSIKIILVFFFMSAD